MAVQIYAGNLPYNTNDEALKSLFEGFGEVVSSKIVKDRDTGRSKGFGFVEMTDSTAADDAIKQLDG
nr:RNA-binding protein [Spirochaetota bacterium]